MSEGQSSAADYGQHMRTSGILRKLNLLFVKLCLDLVVVTYGTLVKDHRSTIGSLHLLGKLGFELEI